MATKVINMFNHYSLENIKVLKYYNVSFIWFLQNLNILSKNKILCNLFIYINIYSISVLLW